MTSNETAPLQAALNLRGEILKKYPPIKMSYECNLYVTADGCKRKKTIDLRKFSFAEREELLYNDLLRVFLGFNTDLVYCESVEEKKKFICNVSADSVTSATVQKCNIITAKLLEVKTKLSELKNKQSTGVIVQTITGIMETYINTDFNQIIYQLQEKTPKYITNILSALNAEKEVLDEFVTILVEILQSAKFGGRIITYLYDRANSSSTAFKKVSEMQQKMLYSCLDYYNTILYEWIVFGTLQTDPCLEFMIWNVKKHIGITWEKTAKIETFHGNYIEVPSLCPNIYTSVQKYIVNCGKYLHVLEPDILKRCISTVYDPSLVEFKNQYEMRNMIVQACQNHSKSVLHMLVEQHHLFDLIDAFNDIYLGRSAAWVTNLCYSLEEDTFQNSDKTEPRRLNALLNEAWRNTKLCRNELKKMFALESRKTLVELLSEYNANMNGTKQEMSGSVLTYNPNVATESKSTAETIYINLECSEALSLVLSTTVIAQYNIIFKLFFSLHRSINLITEKRTRSDRALSRMEQFILYSMLHFVSKYFSFCFYKIIPPNYNILVKALSKAIYIEDVQEAQNVFLADCFEKCLFNQEKVISMINRILDIINGVCKGHITFDMGYQEFVYKYADLMKALKTANTRNHDLFCWFYGNGGGPKK
uniref:Gamma-tubulin complex component n=1 Tax=Rhabditophanes sp. KR3021 TaxID=114890 RepID=A0AC35U0E6_9BILA